MKEALKSGWLRAFAALVAFSLAGTWLSAATGLKPGPIEPLASAFTILCGCMALLSEWRRALGRWPWSGVLGFPFIGAAAELIGLYTGLPFGQYVYSQAWSPAVPLPGGHWFPLMLPFAWGMMAGAAYLIVRRSCTGFLAAVFAGLLAALIDVPMEPVMTTELGYWTWLSPGPILGVPASNFVGWWLVAGIASGTIEWRKDGSVVNPWTPCLVLGLFGVLLVGLALLR